MATVIPKSTVLSPLTTTSAVPEQIEHAEIREKTAGAPAIKKVAVLTHPLAQHALSALRNTETAPDEYRAYCHQLFLLLALETMRSMPLREEPIETEDGTHDGKILAKPILLLAVTREGLGLAHELARSIQGIQVGSISLNPSIDGKRPEPRLHIFNSPVLSEVRTILFDPVVATGLTATLALNHVRRAGATDITLLSFLTSSKGLSRLQTTFPELSICTAAIDEGWDAKRGPLPGIGNFSERMFG